MIEISLKIELKFEEHVNKIRNILNKILNALNRITNHMNLDQKMVLRVLNKYQFTYWLLI